MDSILGRRDRARKHRRREVAIALVTLVVMVISAVFMWRAYQECRQDGGSVTFCVVAVG